MRRPFKPYSTLAQRDMADGKALLGRIRFEIQIENVARAAAIRAEQGYKNGNAMKDI